ncbi:hypothetical protein Tco_0633878 [Tanacetum coccineum]
MASTSSSEQQAKKLSPASNAHFEVEDGTINFNYRIVILESKNTPYFPMLQFLSYSCISAALTKQPSAYYSKYFQELWYTAEADTTTKSITSTLSKFDKPLYFDLDVFLTVIGLKRSENFISLPPKETLHHVTGKKERKSNICYIRYLSLIIEHLLRDTDVITDDTADQSSSGTSMQPATQPKAKTDKKLRRKKIPASSEPKASKISLESSESAEDQENQPETTDATKVQEIIVEKADHVVEEEDHDKEIDSSIISMGDVRLKDLSVNDEDIPFDTESVIKVVKRFQPPQTDDENQITFLGLVCDEMDQLVDEPADFDLHLMPDDDVESISWFEAADSNKEGNENTVDNILDEMADLKSSADKPLDTLGHLQTGISSLSNKVDNLESSLAKKVSSKLEESVPIKVANAFEERMPELLSDELKNILPNIIEESIQFVSLQKELLTAIRAKVRKSVRKTLWKEIDIVKDCLSYCGDKMEKSSLVSSLRDQKKKDAERVADPLPITKINYKIDKKLGFSEWIKVYTLTSKNKIKANDILLKNLKAKFEWIKTQAKKLGIPPPELPAFGLFAAEKKRKRNSEILKEVFVKEDIIVDGMHPNLVPPPGV